MRSTERGLATLITVVLVGLIAGIAVLASGKFSILSLMGVAQGGQFASAFDSAEYGWSKGFEELNDFRPTQANRQAHLAGGQPVAGAGPQSGSQYSGLASAVNQADLTYRLSLTGTFSGAKAPVAQDLRILPYLVKKPKDALIVYGNLSVPRGFLTATNNVGPGWAVVLGGRLLANEGLSTLPKGSVAVQDASVAAGGPNGLFAQYFGGSYEDFKAALPEVYHVVPPDGTPGTWRPESLPGYDGKRALGGQATPTLLVLDNAPSTSGTLEIYGIVVVRGNWVQQAGVVSIYGGLIVLGDLMMNGGSLSVTRTSVYQDLDSTLDLWTGRFIKVPGSWRDF